MTVDRREVGVAKVINCPCGFVLRAETEEEVIAKAKEHAKAVHNMELSP